MSFTELYGSMATSTPMKVNLQSGFSGSNNSSNYNQTTPPKNTFENFQVRSVRSRLMWHFNDFPRFWLRRDALLMIFCFNFPEFSLLFAVRQPLIATQFELRLQRHYTHNAQYAWIVEGFSEFAALWVNCAIFHLN